VERTRMPCEVVTVHGALPALGRAKKAREEQGSRSSAWLIGKWVFSRGTREG